MSYPGWIFSRAAGVLLLALAAAGSVFADEAKPSSAPSPAKSTKYKDFAEVTKDAKKLSGLVDLYQVDQHVYAALKPADFDAEYLAPISVAKGVAAAGTSFNYDDQWIVSFRRAGDNVQVLRKNHRYEAPKGSPLEKAIRLNYADSVLLSTPVVSDNAPDGAILIDLNDVFLTNFANLPASDFDRNRSSWSSVKAFPNNIELQVEATYGSNPMTQSSGVNGDQGFVDRRGVTLVLHYSLVRMPDDGYKPRLADPRLGHFVSATKDFGSRDPDSNFVRRINRWRLEKADPDAALSPPKRQIVWWIEDTVPLAYRPYVEAGILEWNKAFEKIGFKNAIAVRWQNENDSFDPEDVNHAVFRWVTTPAGMAMSNLRSNPRTGEIIDGDILFDSSWIRYWHREQAYLVDASSTGALDRATVADVGEIVSPAMAAQYGFGTPLALRREISARNSPQAVVGQQTRDVVPGDRNLPWPLAGQAAPESGACAQCQLAGMMQGELLLAEVAAGTRSAVPTLNRSNVSEEVLGQVLKEVVMHETGHSLGLRHNFRGSTLLPLAKLHDLDAADKEGFAGSIMDYLPINLAHRGQPQGVYTAKTLGPYDYWAIEYAYKPIEGDESKELKRIASRSTEPALAYGSDEDYLSAYDPYINQYDLGDDPLAFAANRVALARESLADIDDRLIADGESWARLRPAVLTLLQHLGDATFLASRFVGGRRISHDFRGQEGAREPIVPVPADKQREALKFIAAEILADAPAKVRPELLRKMATEHWSHWGADTATYEGKVGVSLDSQLLAVQNIALRETLGSGVRMRLIESNRGLALADDKPLELAEVFDAVSDPIWAEVSTATEGHGEATAAELKLSAQRRNLQRLHVQYLADILVAKKDSQDHSLAFALFLDRNDEFPPDARSLARDNLKRIRNTLRVVLEGKTPPADSMTRVHLESLADEIDGVLEASRQPARLPK